MYRRLDSRKFIPLVNLIDATIVHNVILGFLAGAFLAGCFRLGAFFVTFFVGLATLRCFDFWVAICCLTEQRGTA
jgi:hypothetical protein